MRAGVRVLRSGCFQWRADARRWPRPPFSRAQVAAAVEQRVREVLSSEQVQATLTKRLKVRGRALETESATGGRCACATGPRLCASAPCSRPATHCARARLRPLGAPPR